MLEQWFSVLKRVCAFIGMLIFLYLSALALRGKLVNSQLASPLLLLAAAIALVLLLVMLQALFKRLGARNRRLFWGTVVVLSICLQFYLAFNFFGDNVWDGIQIKMQAFALAGGGVTKWASYFSSFPNNVTPVLLLTGIVKLLGPSPVAVAIVTNVLMMLLVDVTFLSLYTVMKRRLNQRIATVYLLIAAGFFPFYGLALFFYPDGLAVAFPILAAVCFERYQDRPRNKWWLFAGSVTIWIGYEMKPNIAVIMMALGITFVLWMGAISKGTVKKVVVELLMVLLVFGGGMIGIKGIQKAANYHIDNSVKIPWQHWTMMGVNEQSRGAVSLDDYAYTIRYKTLSEKKRADNKVITSRVKALGVGGLVKQMYEKSKLQWSNGSMDSYGTLNQFRSYPKGFEWLYGSRTGIWQNVTQVLYLTSLILAAFSCFVTVFKKGVYRYFSWYWSTISVIGIFLFHALMWEAENRYAFIVLPFILLLAATGLSQLSEQVDQLRDQRQTNGGPSRGLVQVIALGIGIILVAAGLATSWSLTQPQPVSLTAAKQTRTTAMMSLKANASVTQKIDATHSFNHLLMQVPLEKGVRISLINARGKKVVTQSAPLPSGQDNNLGFSMAKQPAGTYKLIVKNKTHSTVKMAYIDAGKYPISKHSFKKGAQHFVVLDAYQTTLVPVIGRSLMIFIGIMIIMIYGAFIVIDRRYQGTFN